MDIEVWLNLTIHKLKGFKAEPLCSRGTTVKSNGFIFWTSVEQKIKNGSLKFITENAPLGPQLQILKKVRGRELFQLLTTRKVAAEIQTSRKMDMSGIPNNIT